MSSPRCAANVGEDEAIASLRNFALSLKWATIVRTRNLLRAARTAVALDQLVKQNDLDLLAYFYKGSGVRRQ